MANNIGAYHIANSKIYDIQRNNNFIFTVTFDKGALQLPNGMSQSTRTLSTSEAQETLQLAVHSVSTPNFSQETISINRGNSTIKVAGKPSFSEGSLVINDYLGVEAKALLQAWQRLSYQSNKETVGYMKDYKFTGTLILYSPSYEQVGSWTLYGCWISSLSESDFSMDDSGKHMVTATLVYDHAEPTV